MNIILLESEFVSFYKGSSGSASITIPRKSEVGNHIVKVLRSRPGDTLRVGILGGFRGIALVEEIGSAVITLKGELLEPVDRPNPVILGVGYSRPISMKRILREAAMLGAQAVWLYPTELGEKSYMEASIWQEGRYKNFLIDGASQGGGSYIPEVRFFKSLEELFAESAEPMMEGVQPSVETDGTEVPTYVPVVCDVGEDATPLMELVSQHEVAQTLLVCIGSERGWSEKEREVFRTAGCAVGSLGNRILRTETACALALGVVELNTAK